MTRLASRFGAANLIRRDRPLTREELFRVVPSVFSEDKHESRSERYTYIPTISLLDSLQREGFQPFFACQTRVRDPGRREHTKHMLRLRREGQITGKQVPEIILLNSHDGTSSYQMLPGLFRAVCQNGLVCGESFGEVRVPHKGDVVSQVIEGAYEVLGIFDRVEEKRDAMQSLLLPPPAQQALAKAALTYRFGEDHQPVTESQILSPRRWQDESNDLWTTYQRIQENLIKGGLSGRNAKGGRSHTRAVRGIDGARGSAVSGWLPAGYLSTSRPGIWWQSTTDISPYSPWMKSIWFSPCRRLSGVTTVCVVLLKTRALFSPYPIFALSSSHCLRLFRPTAHQNSASVVINPATGRSPMPVIAIIAIVVIVIILNKTGVSDSLAALTLATVAALLTGGGAAGAASVALTPFVGVPVGIFVGIYVFAKVVRLISGKK